MNAVLSSTDFETLGIRDQLGDILDLVQQLRRFDLDKIKELVDIVTRISTAKDLPTAIRAGIDALRLGATLTETTVDDKLVATLDQILTEQVLSVIVKIVAGLLNPQRAQALGVSGGDFVVTSAEKIELSAQGIDFAVLMQIALMLLPLLQKFFAQYEKPLD